MEYLAKQVRRKELQFLCGSAPLREHKKKQNLEKKIACIGRLSAFT